MWHVGALLSKPFHVSGQWKAEDEHTLAQPFIFLGLKDS